jgi:DNA-binding CsgD family transcriptional regulator
MEVDDATAYAFAPIKVRGRPKGEKTIAPLTAREREAAALITQGLTNREIAAELVNSERTVDRHIENVLDRLELTSRTQIARWVFDRTKDRASGQKMGITDGSFHAFFTRQGAVVLPRSPRATRSQRRAEGAHRCPCKPPV